MDNILTISFIVQSLIATVTSSSSALLHRRNLKRRHDRHRTLITGVVACSGCASANNEECVSRTIGMDMDDQCGACANGQSYWPCDIENECWCWDKTLPRDPGDGNPDDCYDTNGDGKCDEYLGIAGQGGTEFTGEIVLPPCFTPCANSFTGNEAVPGTGCRIYHECYLGDIRSKKECGTPLIFDEIRDYCEFPSAVLCPLGNNVVCPDPETVSPTVAPISENPTTLPSESPNTSKPPSAGTLTTPSLTNPSDSEYPTSIIITRPGLESSSVGDESGFPLIPSDTPRTFPPVPTTMSTFSPTSDDESFAPSPAVGLIVLEGNYASLASCSRIVIQSIILLCGAYYLIL